MESLALIFFSVLIIFAIFVVYAEYSFINLYRKKGFEKRDSEYNTLIFLLLHPDYNIRTFFIALKRTKDKEVEKARIIYLLLNIMIVLYMFGIGVFITYY